MDTEVVAKTAKDTPIEASKPAERTAGRDGSGANADYPARNASRQRLTSLNLEPILISWVKVVTCESGTNPATSPGRI